ncbi:sulfatase [Pseudomonadales bacterium]|nr:sulfatase [Pseudomonadales bacterium]MDB4806606.1 sulfatase [Pseudomonadales bacterium]
MHYKLTLLLLFFVTSCSHWSNASADKQPNVLFIMVDDLRVELGSYGGEHVRSPNIDTLAQQGTRFANAYVSVPVCGASRASLFTGMRATRDRFKSYYTWVEKDAPEATTVFEQFKNNGYHTVGYGKIFHQKQDTASKSWTAGRVGTARQEQKPASKTLWRDYHRPENIAQFMQTKKGPSTEMFDGPDDTYNDGQVANKAVETLAKLAQSEQPFFLAVGFVKPHLPFNAPKKYWDMYDADQFELADKNLPVDAPKRAYHKFGELRAYSDIPEAPEPVGDEQARRLIHGYHAAVSYADAQVGKVLDQLDALGLSENTIVVLMGDHGYSLGEHGLWCKHSTFDVATKTPLIIRAPNMPAQQTVEGLVEFIDIFPTLTDLAGIATPAQAAGMSLTPLLNNPSLPARAAVFPRYLAAEAIHNDEYTLTQWLNKKGKVTAQMLYDNKNDPNETRNLANEPKYKKVLKDLSAQLAAHIRTRQ